MFFFTHGYKISNDLSQRVFGVARTSAPQLWCIFSWVTHFRSIYECLSILCIDLNVLKSSQAHQITEYFRKFQYFSLNFIEFRWFPLIFVDFLWFLWIFIDFTVISRRSFRHLMTLSHPNWSKEFANGSETLKNGTFVQKYVEAVVRKSSRLQILAEIDHFEKFDRV